VKKITEKTQRPYFEVIRDETEWLIQEWRAHYNAGRTQSALKNLERILEFYRSENRTRMYSLIMAYLMTVCQHADFKTIDRFYMLLDVYTANGTISSAQLNVVSPTLKHLIGNMRKKHGIAHGIEGNLREMLMSNKHDLKYEDVISGTRAEFIRDFYSVMKKATPEQLVNNCRREEKEYQEDYSKILS
jgi:hypothetical protein